MRSVPEFSACACASLRRANRAITHLYDLVLAPTGLRTSQFNVLRAIAEAGEIAHCDLARYFTASEETFSRRLASARKSGWVRMKTDERHRRIYSLTERGHLLMQSAIPNWERAQHRLRQQLGDKDWQMLLEFSERVTQAAIRAEQAPARNCRPVPATTQAVWPADLHDRQRSRPEAFMQS